MSELVMGLDTFGEVPVDDSGAPVTQPRRSGRSSRKP